MAAPIFLWASDASQRSPRERQAPVTVTDSIRATLTRALTPTRLEVSDDSARHHGHAGSRPDGESHFSVTVVSERFAGLAKIERHRMVYAALAEELAGRVHALQLTTRAPSEEI